MPNENLNGWDFSDFDSGISTEHWVSILNDSTLVEPKHLEILARLKNCENESASCTQLSHKFGETKNFYNSGSSTLAENIFKRYNCNKPSQDANSKWWPILYVGKPTQSGEEGSYIWKLRPELSSALDKIDLSNVRLSAHIKLHEHFEKLLNRPEKYYDEELTANPYAGLISSSSELFYECPYISKEDFEVKGSAGQGGWSKDKAMWVGIRDRRKTNNFTSGIYVVYLISKNCDAIYLTLNQGSSDLVNPVNRMQSERVKIRQYLSLENTTDFKAVNDFELGYGNEDFYCIGSIYYKKYEKSNLPDDEVLNNDLRVLVEGYEKYLNSLNFTWIDFYEKLADSLSLYVTDRVSLLDKLKKIFFNISADKKIPKIEDPEGSEDDIDPFTVYAMFDSQPNKRAQIITALAKSLKIDSDFVSDFNGIPSSNPQNVAYFPFRDTRQPNDIETLWKLFNAAITYSVDKSNEAEFCLLFDSALKIKQIALPKLTQALFRIRPNSFISMDGTNKTLLESPRCRISVDREKMWALLKNPSGAKYCEFCKNISDSFSSSSSPYKSFPELSYDAYLASNPSVWKISHGTATTSENIYLRHSELESEKYIAVETNLDESQLKAFQKEMKIGDYFYLCYGSENVTLIGIITGEPEECNITANTTLARRYEVISDHPLNENEFKAQRRPKWLPNGNSYVAQVKPADFSDFENLLLKPYFGISVQELFEHKISVDAKNPRSYWLLNHTWNDCVDKSEGQMNLISFALKNNCCIMHYEPSLAEDNLNWKRKITEVVNTAPQIKEGDVIILRGGDYIYAYGYATIPQKSIETTVTLNDFHKNGKNAGSSDIFGKVIGFTDAPVFYCDYKNVYNAEDEEYWSQRIDVDRWYGVCSEGFREAKSIDKSHVYIPMSQISEEDGKKLIKLLGGNMEDYREILLKVHNIVLTGAPGTGKTFLASDIAHLVAGDDSRIYKVQFHPSYDYTDFVEGLRPVQQDGGAIGFKRKDGIFKLLCKKAKDDPNNKYVLIIDEINRGDISKIFGELFSLIEHDYRGKIDAAIDTQYSNLIDIEHLEPGEWDSKKFYVPDNVYIIGTMNDIDRSVESMDFAIRRRFTWLELKASESLGMLNAKVKNAELREQCITRMNSMNSVISKTTGLGSAYEIGGAYFAHVTEFDESEAFAKLWEYYLSPIVKEYLRGFPDSSKYEAIKDAFDNPQTQELETTDASNQ